VYTENDYFASFGGFGPLNDPALVGFVVLDTPRGGFYYGGLVSAPVFSRIMADALAYLRVPPDDDPWEARRDELKAKADKDAVRRKSKPKRKDDESSDDPPATMATLAGQVPDVRGQSARGGVAGLVARGYRARVDGSGIVVRQSPPPGTPLAAGQACTLRMGLPEELVEEGRKERAAEAAASVALVAASGPAPIPASARRRH